VVRSTRQSLTLADLTAFLGSNKDYGSYRVLANLTITIDGITQYANYNRSLDLNTGVHSTTFLGNDNNVYSTATYCSHPAQACIYRVSSTGKLPNVAVSLENRLIGSNLYNATCGSSQVRLNGITQKGPPRGMEYDLLVRLSTGPLGMPMASCSHDQRGTLVVTGSAYGEDLVLKSFSVIIGAGTDYDQTKGNAANKFSFRGVKPGPIVDKVTAQSSTKLESKLLISHIQDYQGLMNAFGLELYDPWKASQYPSESLEFFQLLDRYKYSAGITGNNKKRDTGVSKVEKWDSKYCIGKRCKRQPQYNGPPTATTPAWQNIAPPTAFPQFNFPSTLHSGFNPTKPVPWSTDGFATVSIEGLGTRTITLTRSQTPSPTALPPIPSPTGPPVIRVNFAEENLADGPNAGQGDPYMESLLFDYARHLFISSSREESLPPNLQGIWTDQIESAWSGDFHANINFQMNHWFADQTGLGHLQTALWNYIQDTWVSSPFVAEHCGSHMYTGSTWR
jgi:Glycosyl hydrolase family 65, N-terminal domain